ncbi:hypothetical protein DSECCO2_630240 [anaerobic digester metagenome]
MYGSCPRFLSSGKDGFNIQIGFRKAFSGKQNRFAGLQHMLRVPVVIRIYSHHRNAHTAGGFLDAEGDFAAVGYKKFHGRNF